MKIAMSGRLVTLSGFALLAGCAGSPPPRIGAVDSRPVEEFGQGIYTANESRSYTLRPSDVVAINVFREPELSVENVPIGADGTISLPLIGAVRAEGLTAEELSQTITRKLAAGFLRKPAVSVNVLQFGSHLVTVEGSVEKPGVYQFRPGARLSAAISLASGPTRIAKLNQVAVFRDTPEGMMVAKFDYAAVRNGTMMDPVLQPGDRVVLGTSGLSQAWQDLLQALPLFALFTRI